MGAEPGEAVTAIWSEYVAAASLSDVPPAVIHEALRAVVNIVGCAVGGADHSAVKAIERTFSRYSGRAEAHVIGRRPRYDLLLACLLNAASASAHAFDDTHAEAMVHPSAPVVPAIFGIAERDGISGGAFLTAYIIGAELTCRLSKAISVRPAKAGLAWIQTGVCGAVGAAVAAGKLLNLKPHELRHAMGIAAAQSSGLRGLQGSMCTSFIPAHASRSGLQAALLAQNGFTSADAGVEGKFGFLEAFSSAPNPLAVTDSLGSVFELSRNGYKPYPCGVVIHPAIDAILAIRKDNRLDPNNIRSIVARLSPVAVAVVDRSTPRNSNEAQVSAQHWIAAALVFGKAGLAEASQYCVDDPLCTAVRTKVILNADPQRPADSGHVSITMQDGSVIEHNVTHCVGSAQSPMTDAGLDEKFLCQTVPVLTEAHARRLKDLLWSIDSAETVATVAAATAPTAQ